MKVITEEMLREKFTSLYWGTDNCDQLLEKLLAECKEIGTLEVSKLRPMSEAPRAESIMVKLSTEDELHEGFFIPSGMIRVGTLTFKSDSCEGWVPKTIYKPEEPTKEMIWPDACG